MKINLAYPSPLPTFSYIPPSPLLIQVNTGKYLTKFLVPPIVPALLIQAWYCLKTVYILLGNCLHIGNCLEKAGKLFKNCYRKLFGYCWKIVRKLLYLLLWKDQTKISSQDQNKDSKSLTIQMRGKEYLLRDIIWIRVGAVGVPVGIVRTGRNTRGVILGLEMVYLK